MNLPNKLSILRMCMIPVFAVFFLLDVYVPYNYLISAIIFVLAAFTDFLDGMIARKYNLVTNFGKFLDPIADKVLVATAYVLICLIPFPSYTAQKLIAVAVSIILARELIISGFRMQAASMQIVLAADKTGKIKTVCQDVSIVVLLLSFDFPLTSGKVSVLNTIGLCFLGLAVVMTIVSGLNYILKNKRVLKDE